MKSNLFINTGDEILKKPKFNKNNSSKFISLINNKSLTNNTSGTTFSTPQNSIEQNKNSYRFIHKNIKLKKSNSKFSSLYIFTSYNTNKENDKFNNNIILPHIITTKDNINILKKADTIIKVRHGKYSFRTLKQTKSSLLEKSNQICLNNFLITQIKKERNEINNLKDEINSKLNEVEFEYQNDYRNFLFFQDNLIKKIKDQEDQFNKLQKLKYEKENAYSEEKIITQHLESKIESMTKQIILKQNYAKFIHKIYNSPFFFEEINKMNLKEKKYLEIYENILEIFEKNKKIFEENYKVLDESEEFMKRFKFFERKIIQSFQVKDKIKDEIKKIKIFHNKLLEQLIIRKNDCQKEYQSLNDLSSKIKNEINDLDNYQQNNVTNLDICKTCIFDLGIYLGLEIDKNMDDISPSEFTVLCKKILSFLTEKENLVNDYIYNIENLLHSEGKEIIEDIIDIRKKINKKQKYREYLSNQNIEAEKRKFKVNKVERKIVIKGRKIFRPNLLIKKKKKVLNKKKIDENDSFEYFQYFSDKDDL